jgi:hypothetical protein
VIRLAVSDTVAQGFAAAVAMVIVAGVAVVLRLGARARLHR